jgi:hypothetical protein
MERAKDQEEEKTSDVQKETGQISEIKTLSLERESSTTSRIAKVFTGPESSGDLTIRPMTEVETQPVIPDLTAAMAQLDGKRELSPKGPDSKE